MRKLETIEKQLKKAKLEIANHRRKVRELEETIQKLGAELKAAYFNSPPPLP